MKLRGRAWLQAELAEAAAQAEPLLPVPATGVGLVRPVLEEAQDPVAAVRPGTLEAEVASVGVLGAPALRPELAPVKRPVGLISKF